MAIGSLRATGLNGYTGLYGARGQRDQWPTAEAQRSCFGPEDDGIRAWLALKNHVRSACIAW